MSCADELLPFFELLAGNLLSRRDIVNFLNSANRQIIDYFGEVAHNLCIVPIVDLSQTDKVYLARFQKVIVVIANKTTTMHIRRSALAKNPFLAKKFAELLVKKVWKN